MEDLGQAGKATYNDIDAPSVSEVKISYKRKVVGYSDL